MIIVNPNNSNGSPYAAIEPPIWCAYEAAAFMGDNEILDAEMERLTIDETIERIGDKLAVLVAMGQNPSASSTPKMTIIDELKKREIRYLVTGLHPQAIKGKVIHNPEEWVGVSPRWDLIDFSKYRAHNWHCLHDLDSRYNYGVIYTSFGCPYNCDYCNIHALYGTRKVAYREPKAVIEEIAYLVSRGVKNLKIADELFLVDNRHTNDILDTLIEMDFGLNIWAYAREDTLHPMLLKKAKKAGINWVAIGFETAVGKTGCDPKLTKKFCEEANINVIGNFMFGLPGETSGNWWETYNLAEYLNCEYANFYVALPYPGSKWYDSLKDKPTDWSTFNQFSPNICAGKEVVKFRDEAFQRYFLQPRYLEMIEKKFGASAHIKDMLNWKFR